MQSLNLLYHRVNSWKPDPWTLCVSPQHFAEQMCVLSGLTPRPVVTFDDGYADNLYAALPILERYDIPAIFFVVSGALNQTTEMWHDALERLFFEDGQTTGGEPAYDRYFTEFWRLRGMESSEQERALDLLYAARQRSRAARPERRMLRSDELLKLASSPLVQIGAHTVTHPVLSQLSEAKQRHEIAQSRRQLEHVIHRPVTLFAYPNGTDADYTSQTIRMVREAGYAAAYSAFAHRRDDPFQLPRVMIRDWNGEDFLRVLSEASFAAD